MLSIVADVLIAAGVSSLLVAICAVPARRYLAWSERRRQQRLAELRAGAEERWFEERREREAYPFRVRFSPFELIGWTLLVAMLFALRDSGPVTAWLDSLSGL